MSVSSVWRVMAVVVAGWLLSGCGVQRMQAGEQELKSEWGSMLFLANEQLDVVTKAWPQVASGEVGRRMEAAKAQLKSSMGKWESIPSAEDLRVGVKAMSDGSAAVDEALEAAKESGAGGYDKVAGDVKVLREKARVARDRYTIAARTYNDILRLYPSKWMAKAMMMEPAVTFESDASQSGAITQASMLDKLGAARDR